MRKLYEDLVNPEVFEDALRDTPCSDPAWDVLDQLALDEDRRVIVSATGEPFTVDDLDQK